MTTIKVRFAPSPTGTLHIGTARTAIFNWLFARRNNGEFYLRIEDTDRERSKDEYVQSIKHGLNWLGLNWDGDIFFQSQHIERHKEVAQALVEKDMAYHCYTTQEEIQNFRDANPGKKFVSKWRDGAQYHGSAPPVVRLRINDDGTTKINDLVLGEIEVKNGEMDDMVLLRSDKTPTYLLSCVVDDYDMQISHIIRGNDHLTNTFRQLQILKAMGWKEPSYAHIPLIHGDDGRKISKRDGALGLEEYQENGYLPEALFNYLLRLGWGHEDREIISAQEAIQIFDLADISKSPARFDIAKLHHLNQHYIQTKTNDALEQLICGKLGEKILTHEHKERIKNAIPLIKTRGETINEIAELASVFISPVDPMDEKSKEVLEAEGSLALLQELYEILSTFEEWTAENFKIKFNDFANNRGIKPQAIMKLLRAALLGTFKSPPIYETIEILQKHETLSRISKLFTIHYHVYL
jgi:glutamyl-tRNA synthetase